MKEKKQRCDINNIIRSFLSSNLEIDNDKKRDKKKQRVELSISGLFL